MFGLFGKKDRARRDDAARSPVPEIDHKIVLMGPKLEAAIHYISGSGLVYMNNAKSGCSSIKKSLWLSKSPNTFTQPHDKGRSPFRHQFRSIAKDVDQLRTASVFTMVRNPYVRVLSAYLDKIATGKGGVAGAHFRNRFGIQGQIPGFSQFLKLIATEEPELLDQHFAPQFYTTLHPLIRYDFIGHIEQIERVGRWLADWNVPQEEFRPHATNAADFLERHYTDADFAMVRHYYRLDFDAFGYSEDPAILSPVSEARLPDVARSNLADLVTVYSGRRGKQTDEALSRLTRHARALDVDHLRLDAGLMSADERLNLEKRLPDLSTASWQTAARLAEFAEAEGRLQDANALRSWVRTRQFPPVSGQSEA